MSSLIDLSAYEAWLKKERYQASTRLLSVRNLRTIAKHPNKKVASHLVPQAQRYLRFVAQTKKNPMGAAFVARLKKQNIEPSEAIKKTGKRRKNPLTDAQLAKFRAKLREGGDVDKLIAAYMFSDTRVTEFLNAPCSLLQASPDKLSRVWVASVADVPWTHPIYKLLCKTERCAYSRMRTRMRELAEQLKMDLDLNTIYMSRKERADERVAA